jgi:hypothetical protein
LKSNLTILLAHLLKLTAQKDVPGMMTGSWHSFFWMLGKTAHEKGSSNEKSRNSIKRLKL